MNNSDQISSRLLVLRQAHCELAEQLEQLEKLRKKLRAAERQAAAQTRMIDGPKYAPPVVKQTAAHDAL